MAEPRPTSSIPVIAAAAAVVALGLYIVVRRPAPVVTGYATFPSSSAHAGSGLPHDAGSDGD